MAGKLATVVAVREWTPERTPERSPERALAQRPHSRGHDACLGQPGQQDRASEPR